MHDMNAWDSIWMSLMMFSWIVPVALAVYFGVRLANGRPTIVTANDGRDVGQDANERRV